MGAVVAVLLAGACSSNDVSSRLTEDEDIQGPTLDNVVARIYKGSEIETIVQATRAVYDITEKTNRLTLNLVRVAFYDGGVQRGEMMSNKGVLYLSPIAAEGIEKDDIVLSGTVRLTLKDGSSVSAPEIRYYSKKGILVSSGGPFEQQMRSGSNRLRVTGERFEMNKDMTRFVWDNARMENQESTVQREN